jgi:ribulose-bisphosphate carboxylase small chain
MDTAIRDYPSRADSPAARRLGTFSYLPAMDAGAIRRQVTYMIGRGWTLAVEHVEPARAGTDYWYLWKLPLFGERNVDAIVGELLACRNAHPGDHVRIAGLDAVRQTKGSAFVVYRGGDSA